jgi:hypothetical protein
MVRAFWAIEGRPCNAPDPLLALAKQLHPRGETLHARPSLTSAISVLSELGGALFERKPAIAPPRSACVRPYLSRIAQDADQAREVAALIECSRRIRRREHSPPWNLVPVELIAAGFVAAYLGIAALGHVLVIAQSANAREASRRGRRSARRKRAGLGMQLTACPYNPRQT